MDPPRWFSREQRRELRMRREQLVTAPSGIRRSVKSQRVYTYRATRSTRLRVGSGWVGDPAEDCTRLTGGILRGRVNSAGRCSCSTFKRATLKPSPQLNTQHQSHLSILQSIQQS